MKAKPELRFGLVGGGYMGKAYAIALHSAATVFSLSARPVAEMIAATSKAGAQKYSDQFGFKRATGDWRLLVTDPDVDVVAICTPTWLHREIALAAIAAGKHVICEKPLAMSSPDAYVMAAAAERAGVKSLVGYNYIKNPATQLAKAMILSGELGEIIHFRGTHREDYLMDPHANGGWRVKAKYAGNAGALGDVGSHIINLAHFLCGPIAEVIGETQIIHQTRKAENGLSEPIENDDQASFLVKFRSGVLGSIEASRVATGRKNGLTYEITGTRGSIYFDQERLAELNYYSAGDQRGRSGYRTLLVGPDHPEYGNFCVGAGHGFGYNEMITIEIKDMVEGIMAGRDIWPTFQDAAHTCAVVDSVLASHTERCWISII